ncbi:hypothetical protein LTR70_006997 [Exophiala xenobiotica]|uniref:Mob1/phocein n=1 Tax=Lithohypha guttulata TaxID=1690604 RepID=A0ABR0K699_9EURO|nr:hypothetical protein LTR24_006464 [Lithohypha guttulata]KAK5314883.1 hypothetical protein LTR70_006997 [Exophiala xenobiotica]
MAAKSPARQASGAPPSSPRLPSPPPLPELQLGPSSPSVNAAPGGLSLDNSAQQDDGAARRVRPGTGAADMARGPPFVPLHQLESPFQLQEYLKSSYCSVTRDNASNTLKPITKASAMQLATPPTQQDTGEPVDRNLWLYELCRFLVQRTNRLIVSFFADSPPCSNQTCPEMRASEWQYLCAVHEPPKSCCAIDYCCHTLDWAANVLTSTKHFPSRLSLGGEGGSAYQSMRQLTNIFRRVYRIYAHAWFQHREAFWMLEQEEGLYKFFRTVCDAYTLIPEDNYTIPPEAEGDRDDFIDTPISQGRPDIAILRNDTQINLNTQQHPPQAPAPAPAPAQRDPEPAPAPPSTPAQSMPNTTRRHRHTPSTGTQVTVIAEGLEEEEEDPSNENGRGQISQAVPAETAATSTTQLSSSPPKPQSRSPKPEMSIPIAGTQADDLRAPEDPTPTLENHDFDPFNHPGSTAAAAEAATQMPAHPFSNAQHDTTNDMEPPTPLTAVDQSQSLPPMSKTPMPPLQTQTPPPTSNEDEEVRSPGGGSIRTVGGDILSGILAHCDVDNDGNALPPNDEIWAKTEATEDKTIPLDPAAEVEAGVAAKELGKASKGEADEEMGEIKLDRTTTAIPDPESESAANNSKDADEQPKVEEDKKADVTEETKENREEPNADGTKTAEVASGVV